MDGCGTNYIRRQFSSAENDVSPPEDVLSSSRHCPVAARPQESRPVATSHHGIAPHHQESLVLKKKRPFLPLDGLLLVAVFLLAGCKPDTTPDAFTFADQSKVAPDTPIESEPVIITGINIPAQLSITGGEYSIDGRAYRDNPGVIMNDQEVRIRVRSSSESSGVVSATLTIGGVSDTFTVKTVNFTGRVEAEDASATAGASTVGDAAASKGNAVFLGAGGLGISIDESLDAKALILAYRTDTAGTLAMTVNGAHAGTFTLRPTGGAYATSSVVAAVNDGDVISIANPPTGGSSQTYIDYVEFAASPFRAVSTLASTGLAGTTDGTSVGANGDIYVSGGPGGQNILRITPEGGISVFAAGFESNGSDFDSSGNLYVANYLGSSVRKITPAGVVTTFASSLDGPAGIWVDRNDNVLVSLFGANFSGVGATVLKITPDGVVSTYATGGGLQDVIGIVGDENGRVYASNWAAGQLYEITDGNVNLLAATGGRTNMICYSNGHIYMPSPGDALIRRVSLEGTVETFTGTTTRQTIDGPLAIADFERPNSCAFSPDGTIMYVMDRDTGLLRKIDAGKP
jgi:sugar lactone lactonase YvrE